MTAPGESPEAPAPRKSQTAPREGAGRPVVELRTLTADDWPTWRSLRLVALSEAPYAFGSKLADWQGEGDRVERWRERLGVPGSHNLVATLDGRPVGMASGLPTEDDRVVELVSMYVAVEARGRGVGDALVCAIERWASSVGAALLRLDVAAGSHSAQALYLRNGFTYTGELGEPGTDGRPERVMAKKVAPPTT